MDNYDKRLKTFSAWPHEGSLHSNIAPARMAAAGFYLDPVPPKATDRVICHCCGVELVDWTSNDSPLVAHIRFSPQCKFINKLLDYSDPAKALFVRQLILSSLSEPLQSQVFTGLHTSLLDDHDSNSNSTTSSNNLSWTVEIKLY